MLLKSQKLYVKSPKYGYFIKFGSNSVKFVRFGLEKAPNLQALTSIYDKLKDITKKNTIYQYRRYYIRENKSDLCPTLTANMGTGGHNVPLILDDKGIRKLRFDLKHKDLVTHKDIHTYINGVV